MMWTIPPCDELASTLRDPSSPIGKRMRAAYYAKQVFLNNLQREAEGSDDQREGGGPDDNVETAEQMLHLLCEQVFVKEHGSLLRHEFAYVLGQMQTPTACRALEELLMTDDDCVMVRHEAAEALGAIASPSSRTALEVTRDRYKGVLDELSDTCLLALNRLDFVENGGGVGGSSSSNGYDGVGCACMLAPFNSVDPAAPDPKHVSLTTAELGDILLGLRPVDDVAASGGSERDGGTDRKNERVSLTERYRAMFSLRNRGGEEAVLQLCRSLTDDTSSPLLRHEVAFVLGQLQHPSSIPALEESLSRQEEHTMVRHEAAEALGAIDGSSQDWERIERILKKYQEDSNRAVAESCVVALDAADYWGHCPTTTDDDNDTGGDEQAEERNNTPDTFGKQKHLAPSSDAVRRFILAEHFNVQT